MKTSVLQRRSHYAVVTGASSGLGYAFAFQLAQIKKPLILVALKGESLQEKASLLKTKFGVDISTIEGDLTDPLVKSELQALVAEKPTDLLILNAGIGGSKPIEDASEHWLGKIIDLNVKANALITFALLENLKKAPDAVILTVSSMAALTPMPFKAVYPASKAFQSSWAMGLDAELSDHTRVRSLVLYPGGMLTNEDVQERLKRQSWLGRKTILPVELVAQKALKGIEEGRSRIIPGWANQLNYVLFKFIPWKFRSKALVRFMKTELDMH
jgi:hypothetical protein